VNQSILTNDPTTAPAWWVSGGIGKPDSYPVQLDKGLFFSNGQYVSMHEEGTINMRKPNATIITQTTDVNVIGPAVLFGGSLDSSVPGISFVCSWPQQGFSGEAGFVQVTYAPVRTWQDVLGQWWDLIQPNPGPWLDQLDDADHTKDWYFEPGKNVADNPRQTWRPPLPYCTWMEGHDQFTMWLMYTPPGGMSVPLRAVNWSWSGTATNTNPNGGGFSGWVKAGGDNDVNPPDYPTESYPFWKSRVTMDISNAHIRQ
jgi:hypothetical protein